jgi:hypothetical protein
MNTQSVRSSSQVGTTVFSVIALLFVAVLVVATPKVTSQNYDQSVNTLVGP